MIGNVLLILVLSFAPMLFYALILWWFDRYEKEPLSLLLIAFLWGAIPSIILALILQIVLDIPLTSMQASSLLTYELVGSSLVAPLTEEAVKALALILLLVVLHHHIDSPIDGLIYGGMIGFGFAAVENVFYLLGALEEGGLGGAAGLAFLRGGVFGLNHAMYTGFSGLGVALALEVKRKWLRGVPILVGFSLAVATHALHNALATFISYVGVVPLLLAIVLNWTGVLTLIAVAVGMFFVERRRIVAYGEMLVASNQMTADELTVLRSTSRRRRDRLSQLLGANLRGWWRLSRYQHTVSRAAFAYHRVAQGDTRSLARLARLEQEYRRLGQEAV
jgi:protease PrsW